MVASRADTIRMKKAKTAHRRAANARRRKPGPDDRDFRRRGLGSYSGHFGLLPFGASRCLRPVQRTYYTGNRVFAPCPLRKRGPARAGGSGMLISG